MSDKTDRLLACFEGIDDDLIAEAAHAVDGTAQGSKTLRKASWLRWGNSAAVFIGIIAVSCLVFLAFWLGSAGLGEGATGYDNGYTNGDNGYVNGDSGYANGHFDGYCGECGYNIDNAPNNQCPICSTQDDTPPYLPTRPSFDNGLPLPQIHGTGHLTVLEAGRYRMTANNPWFSAGHLAELPAFLPHATTTTTGTAGNWHNLVNLHLSEDEWNLYLQHIESMAKGFADNIDFQVREIVGQPIDLSEIDFSSVRPGEVIQLPPITIEIPPYDQDERTFMHISAAGTSMYITLPEDSLILPPGASISEVATAQENQEAIDYLANRFSAVFPMGRPTLTLGEKLLDVGGPRTYSRQRFFDAAGSPLFGGSDPVAAILNFNFNWVEVLSFQPDRPQWMFVSTFPQAHFESLQLGYFPIITSDEARHMLIDGYFISDLPDTQWPGEIKAWAADVELVYHMDGEVIMPMYRFLIEVDLPLWWEDEPGDWVAFARYYVPAIRREYLEPMNRRATPEATEAPTGPRALPARLYRQAAAQDYDDWWRPMRVHRHIVEDLWQEVLDDIGGLAVNQAYQFRTACGHYAMITGTRTLTGREELLRYYPALDIPETIGDFTLREIFVYDQTDRMFIFNSPMPQFSAQLWSMTHDSPAPVGEIFTRDIEIDGLPLAYSFAALYENSEGLQVGLAASAPWFDLQHMIDGDFDAVDMGEYGQIYFQGQPGAFYRALYESWGPSSMYVELWFINSPVASRRGMLDLRLLPGSIGIDSNLVLHGTELFVPVPRQALEELVRTFNPSALAAEYQWSFVPWQ